MDLPNELVELILSSLPLATVSAYIMTCRRAAQLSDSHSLWSRLYWARCTSLTTPNHWRLRYQLKFGSKYVVIVGTIGVNKPRVLGCTHSYDAAVIIICVQACKMLMESVDAAYLNGHDDVDPPFFVVDSRKINRVYNWAYYSQLGDGPHRDQPRWDMYMGSLQDHLLSQTRDKYHRGVRVDMVGSIVKFYIQRAGAAGDAIGSTSC